MQRNPGDDRFLGNRIAVSWRERFALKACRRGAIPAATSP
jgi:hypothetical protein